MGLDRKCSVKKAEVLYTEYISPRSYGPCILLPMSDFLWKFDSILVISLLYCLVWPNLPVNKGKKNQEIRQKKLLEK